MFFAVIGLQLCGERSSDEEQVFLRWLTLHRPTYFADELHKRIAERLPVDVLQYMRDANKREFFEGVLHAQRQIRR
jgi:hypothetical protein